MNASGIHWNDYGASFPGRYTHSLKPLCAVLPEADSLLRVLPLVFCLGRVLKERGFHVTVSPFLILVLHTQLLRDHRSQLPITSFWPLCRSNRALGVTFAILLLHAPWLCCDGVPGLLILFALGKQVDFLC